MTEITIVRFLNHLGQGSILDTISLWISDIRLMIALWLIVCIILIVLDKKRGLHFFYGFLIATVIYFLVNDIILKQGLFHLLLPIRPRPFIAYPDIIPIGQKFYDSSFPSGHMAHTAAILTILVANYRKSLLPAIGVLLLMAFTRMHNGMHYPTDLLGGSVLGVLYGLAGYWIIKKIVR